MLTELRIWVISAMVVLPSVLSAQVDMWPNVSHENVEQSSPDPLPLPLPFDIEYPDNHRLRFFPLTAGKYEARIGGASDLGKERLRLDIGASTDLFTVDLESVVSGTPPYSTTTTSTLTFGVDFFTWTRLRDAGGFKFPVEAVDYYFGINGVYYNPRSAVPEYRLRIGHISAHLVDGDRSFSTDSARYMTYSREFIDLTIRGGHDMGRRYRVRYTSLRPYVGVQYLFHTIPDTLGRVTPYAGGEFVLKPDDFVNLILGYELRLNTELETTFEHLFRLGIKIGEIYATGALIEARYYYGRSPFGQHFYQMEETTSLGFAIEF